MKRKALLPLLAACVMSAAVFPCGGALKAVASPLEDQGRAEAGSATGLLISSLQVSVLSASDMAAEQLERTARSIIFLREGEPFRREAFEASLEALKICGEFYSVQGRSEPTADGVRVVFLLTPYQWVKRIRLHGYGPLFRKEVLNVMTFYPGDAFDPDALNRQGRLIRELYARHGFISPRVDVDVRQKPRRKYVVVDVAIQHGPWFFLKSLTLSGNRSFSDGRIRSKMSVWWQSLLPGVPGRYVEEKLTKDVRKLTRFYWSKGYFDCRIRHLVDKDPSSGEVTVHVTIDEGPRYEVEVVREIGFWNWILYWKWKVGKDIVLSKEGNRSNMGLRKSQRNIRESLHGKGFLDAKVSVQQGREEQDGREVRRVSFVIDRGPQSIVEEIRIEGNAPLERSQVDGQMLTRTNGFLRKGAYLPATLQEDAVAIEALYNKEGFTEPKVREHAGFNEERTRVIVEVDIETGPRTTVASTTLNGVTELTDKQIRKAVKLAAGQPFREYMVRSDEDALAALISEQGYPHVKVTGAVAFSPDRRLAHVTYDVNKGLHVRMGEVYVVGNLRARPEYVRRILGLKTGAPFSLARLLEGQQSVLDLPCFRSVQFKTFGLREKDEKVTLFVQVEEEVPYFVQGSVGYETQKGLYGRVRGGDRNFLGRSTNASVGGEVSQIGYQGDLTLVDPRFLATRIVANYRVYGEHLQEFNKDFGTEIVGISATFARRFLKRCKAGMSFQFERRKEFSDWDWLPQWERRGLYFFPRTVFVASPFVQFDSRNSPVHPTRGVYSILAMDISTGIDESLDDFLRYRWNGTAFLTIFPRLTFQFLAGVGFLDPYGPGDEVPQDQLFFLGGSQDVRGFKENMLAYDITGSAVGGRLSLMGSVEAHIDVGYDFEVTPFFDIGHIADTDVTPVSNKVRYSAGAGVGYITPVGSISLQYGFKLNRQPGESIGRLHFLIGYRF